MSMILKLRAGPLPTPFYVLVLRTVLPFHIFRCEASLLVGLSVHVCRVSLVL